MSWTVEKIKALPRTEAGIFDLTEVMKSESLENVYRAAGVVYPVYAAFETTENKKEGYPDIMVQMRVWNAKVKADFNFRDAAEYLAMLLGTIENISPEIYENYRELLDMFREGVKEVLKQYYVEESGSFAAGADEAVKVFCEAVKRACEKDLLLTEKYEMCFR